MFGRQLGLGLVASLALAPLVQGVAAQEFPAGDITIIVPFAAGGGVDTIARLVAEDMRQTFDTTVLVENTPGGSGMIAARALQNAEPDGHTLMLGTAGELAINPTLLKDKLSYDVARDFQPVALAARIPNVFVVGKDSPYHTVAEFIEGARANPGIVTFGSSGIGNPQHLTGELLAHDAGIQLIHVPYKGASQQVVDTIGGQIDATFVSAAAVLGNVQDGSLRALAVTSKDRLDVLPDVPAVSETPGLEDFELVNWFGFVTKAGTNEATVAALHDAITAALGKPETAARLSAIGADYVPTSPAEFQAMIDSETAKFAEIIKTAEITTD